MIVAIGDPPMLPSYINYRARMVVEFYSNLFRLIFRALRRLRK